MREREHVLQLENITMQFGRVVAVNNLSLEVNKGEIVALIGPNGAGKTTAFNVITGVYQPTNGQALFHDKVYLRNHPQGKMKKGYKGENGLLYTSEYKPEGQKSKEEEKKRDHYVFSNHVLAPTPDHITKMGIARTFQNIRLWKSMTVFDNVIIAKHMRAKHNVFSSTFRISRKEEARMPGGNRGFATGAGIVAAPRRFGHRPALRPPAASGNCPGPGYGTQTPAAG